MANKRPSIVPCFLCGDGLEVKNSKRGKPYFICDPCGLQTFVRRKKGIGLLNKVVRRLKNELLANSCGGSIILEVRALVNRRAELRSALGEIEEKRRCTGLSERNIALDATAGLLRKELRKIEKQLRELPRQE